MEGGPGGKLGAAWALMEGASPLLLRSGWSALENFNTPCAQPIPCALHQNVRGWCPGDATVQSVGVQVHSGGHEDQSPSWAPADGVGFLSKTV